MFMASSKVYETKALIIPGEAGKYRAFEKLLWVLLTALSGICYGQNETDAMKNKSEMLWCHA